MRGDNTIYTHFELEQAYI